MTHSRGGYGFDIGISTAALGRSRPWQTPLIGVSRACDMSLPARLSPRWHWPPLLLLLATAACSSSSATAAVETCNQFSKYYASLGYSPLDAPRAAAAGNALSVCPLATATCCTPKSENSLVLSSKKWLHSGLSPVTHAARSHLHRLSVDMDEFFAGLLARAHKELHDMFTRAYGVQYLQNADVFDRLFGRFRGYYGGSDDDLAATVRSFFAEIFSRMYKMINAADKAVTAPYLERCVADQLERLAPFGDIPIRLGQGVKRALVVARTFMQGLSVGHHAFLSAANWVQNPSTSCLHTVTRLLHCAACAADGAPANTSSSSPLVASQLPAAPRRMACHASCVTAVRSCYSSPFIDSWDKYISAMDAVGARLEDEGAFNLESVLGPLKDSISAAIMDYNSNHVDIEKKIATIPGCQKGGSQRPPAQGEPRGRRAANRAQQQRSAAARTPPRAATSAGSRGSGGSSTEQTLRRLVVDARGHLRRLRGMWKNLDGQLCLPGMGVAAPSNGSCTAAADGSSESSRSNAPDRSLNATEFSLDAVDDDSMANVTRLLKLVTDHLKEALGEQRNITWLRVQTTEFLTPSDAEEVGTAAKAGGSSVGIRGSGDDSDNDRESSGSGDGVAGGRLSSQQPRPGPTREHPSRPRPTGPPRRRPSWDEQDDVESSGDGSGMPGGDRRALSYSTRGPPPPTGPQRTTSRPMQSGSSSRRASGNRATSGRSWQPLWHLCLLVAGALAVAFSSRDCALLHL